MVGLIKIIVLEFLDKNSVFGRVTYFVFPFFTVYLCDFVPLEIAESFKRARQSARCILRFG